MLATAVAVAALALIPAAALRGVGRPTLKAQLPQGRVRGTEP
jgi:hypothetical protein